MPEKVNQILGISITVDRLEPRFHPVILKPSGKNSDQNGDSFT